MMQEEGLSKSTTTRRKLLNYDKPIVAIKTLKQIKHLIIISMYCKEPPLSYSSVSTPSS
jgi:hypothetical protein